MAQAAAAKMVAKLSLNGNMISGKCVAAIRSGLKDALGREDVLGGCGMSLRFHTSPTGSMLCTMLRSQFLWLRSSALVCAPSERPERSAPL